MTLTLPMARPGAHRRPSVCERQTELAQLIFDSSIDQWGLRRATALIGRDEVFAHALQTLLHFAQAESPVLITGESGTGKELFARALYLLCGRRGKSYIAVNCAQYQDGQLLLSELFGHKKGSFTGALADRQGVFEEANGGIVFLDEVAELSLTAQAMLLRTLGEGEVVRVGESRPREVDVRVVAATGRNLKAMIAAGAFREDLYYRLRFLQVTVPPLRDRGIDWKLMLEHYLEELNQLRGTRKAFSAAALDALASHRWPGNIRELKSVVDVGFHMSGTDNIGPEHIVSALDVSPAVGAAPAAVELPSDSASPSASAPEAPDPLQRMAAGGESFWTVIYEPFMERELNRAEVREVLSRGLHEARGSYKRMLPLLGLEPKEYLRFMDFLRHHRLKPSTE